MTQTPTDALRLVPVPYFVLSEAAGLLDCEGYGPLALTLNNMLAAAPASPLPEGGLLWMMHVRGPDDIYPAPDYETAVSWCDYVNDVLARKIPEVMTKAVPAIWSGTPESHAEGLPEAIKGWTLPAAPTGAK